MKERELTCICCPLGCQITAVTEINRGRCFRQSLSERGKICRGRDFASGSDRNDDGACDRGERSLVFR